MDHIRRLLVVDRHDGRGAVGGAVGAEKSAMAQNQRAQKLPCIAMDFFDFVMQYSTSIQNDFDFPPGQITRGRFPKHHIGFPQEDL